MAILLPWPVFLGLARRSGGADSLIDGSGLFPELCRLAFSQV